MVLAMMASSYNNEKLDDGTERVVMKLHPALAPVKVAVLPLMKKDAIGKTTSILKPYSRNVPIVVNDPLDVDY